MSRSTLVTATLTLVFPLVWPISAEASENFHLRGNLASSRAQFEQSKQGHVAFIGGSITEMNGYRPMVCSRLERQFPGTKFTFTNAGISSTCSTTGAFRLGTDVLNKGPVDLFFIEFAVNDDQDAGHAQQQCIRGMEGIIRQARRHNPKMDIVITYFVNPGMLKMIQTGKTPPRIDAHAKVAQHYNISTIHLAQEVADQIGAGELTWKKFGGTHPAPHGNAICADMIDRLLQSAWRESPAKSAPHKMPKTLDMYSYANGRFVSPTEANVVAGWQLHVPDWKKLPGGKRSRFTSMKMLTANEPGAKLTLKFEGTAVGAYVVAGPDAGTVEASIDGGDATAVNLFHRYSRGLHYPRTVMFAADLKPGKHTLELVVGDEKSGAGHAARIMQFTVNGTP